MVAGNSGVRNRHTIPGYRQVTVAIQMRTLTKNRWTDAESSIVP